MRMFACDEDKSTTPSLPSNQIIAATKFVMFDMQQLNVHPPGALQQQLLLPSRWGQVKRCCCCHNNRTHLRVATQGHLQFQCSLQKQQVKRDSSSKLQFLSQLSPSSQLKLVSHARPPPQGMMLQPGAVCWRREREDLDSRQLHTLIFWMAFRCDATVRARTVASYTKLMQSLIAYITSACSVQLSIMRSNISSSDACIVHILPHLSQHDHTAIKVTAQPFIFPSSSSDKFPPPSFIPNQALLCDVTGSPPIPPHFSSWLNYLITHTFMLNVSCCA
jgi:hypothetical protein